MRDALPGPQRRAHLIVIGCGNALRGDDAAGLRAAALVRARAPDGVLVVEHAGDGTGLLDLWDGAAAAVVLDAVRSGSPPGTLHRFDASGAPLPRSLRATASTHAAGLAEAIELARALRRLPATVILHGVEGTAFETGTGPSPEVERALVPLAEAALRDVRALSRRDAAAARRPGAVSGIPR